MLYCEEIICCLYILYHLYEKIPQQLNCSGKYIMCAHIYACAYFMHKYIFSYARDLTLYCLNLAFVDFWDATQVGLSSSTDS